MSGALVDLVAKGVQDAYLTGNPEVSFFRSTYKRHTNFSFRPYRLDYTGTFDANNEVVVKIPNKGDLLSYIWIENPEINNYKNDASLFRSDQKPTEIELYIGGQLIDRQDSLFSSFVWPFGGYSDSGSKVAISDGKNYQSAADTLADNFYPLHFFFCDSYKNALPLLALQYHEVEIRIKCRGGTLEQGSTPKIYANYIFLDTDERKHFVDVDHQMLIPQVQRLPIQTSSMDLSYLNHPVQALHLASTSTSPSATISTSYNLYINGTSLHEDMTRVYSRIVSLYHHSKYLTSHFAENQNNHELHNIPFTLTTSWTQPSGSVNFSRLDNAKLQLSGYNSASHQFLYAVNWNILRIKKGMAGLAFSN